MSDSNSGPTGQNHISGCLPYSRDSMDALAEARYVEIYDGHPVEGENILEFRLIYTGKLYGSGSSNKHPEIKHAMRREFHPQLRQLWRTEHHLDEWARRQFTSNRLEDDNGVLRIKGSGRNYQDLTNEDIRQMGINCLSENWERCGYKFVPLVTEEMFLRCSIDILLLRPEDRHSIITAGDLDGRVMTVFDALRIPNTLAEAAGQGPQDDETPFFCLLSDDKWISALSVTTGKLLTLPKERQVHQSDAFVVVHVKLQPTPGKFQFGHLFE